MPSATPSPGPGEFVFEFGRFFFRMPARAVVALGDHLDEVCGVGLWQATGQHVWLDLTAAKATRVAQELYRFADQHPENVADDIRQAADTLLEALAQSASAGSQVGSHAESQSSTSADTSPPVDPS